MRAEHDYRQWSAAHDHSQRFDAVHARHFQVQRNHIRTQLSDFTQGKSSIHRGTDNFNIRIPLQNNWNQFPHQRGIIDNQDSDSILHAMAPRGIDRDNRVSTAGTFRINTTVPSPRIEAPLTKSLETNS